MPACGQGHIAKELIAHGYDTVATDIADYRYGDGIVDFLETDIPRARHCVTNPPYGNGLADAFIRKSLAHIANTKDKAAFLINISSLCYPNGDPKLALPGTKKNRYAWAVWTSELTNQTSFHWLSTQEYH